MSVKLKGFDEFQKQLKEAGSSEKGVASSMTSKAAGEALDYLVKTTPFRDQEIPEERIPGELRLGWTGFRNMDPRKYGEKLPQRRAGQLVKVDLENTAYYASMVEFGHRQHPGQWVEPIENYLSADRVEPVNFALFASIILNETLAERLGTDLDAEIKLRFPD